MFSTQIGNLTLGNGPWRAAPLGRISTGGVLFLLDMVLVALAWPVLLELTCPEMLCSVLQNPRSLTYPATALLLLYAMGLYRRDAMLERMRSLSRVPLVIGMGAMLAFAMSLLLPRMGAGLINPPLNEEIEVFALAFTNFTACAFIARTLLAVLLNQRVLHRKLLVVGAGWRAWDLVHMLRREGSSLQYDVSLLHEPGFGEVDPRLRTDVSLRMLEGDDLDLVAVARTLGVDQIVVAPDERRGMDLMRLLACKIAGFPVVPYLSFVEKEIRRVDLKRMELSWLLFSEGFSFGTLDRCLKRLFDVLVSAIVLVITSPLLLGAMLAIRMEDSGPIFYRQERVTRRGRVFRIIKLRTMRVDAEAQGAVWARQADNRITRIGNFLRRSRIDELPQLWNVLSGEMSFVGPRPERPMFVSELAAKIPLYHERHMVKAGLTGWAQINYPYGASIDDARSKLSYDLYYVKNFSILFDFVILLQTLRVVLWPSGVR